MNDYRIINIYILKIFSPHPLKSDLSKFEMSQILSTKVIKNIHLKLSFSKLVEDE